MIEAEVEVAEDNVVVAEVGVVVEEVVGVEVPTELTKLKTFNEF